MERGYGKETAAMKRYNDKVRVREHYDRVSPYYHSLWGEHLHHGYWIRGDETKEKAQVQLIGHLAEAANIQPGSKILDVGCGLGASCIYLAKNYSAEVTGITISPVQVKMANQAAVSEKANAKVFLMDAEEMQFDHLFDVIWSVESVAHFPRREKFFAAATRLLKPNGTLAIIDWFRKENLTPAEYRRFIQPIEKGMLVVLQTMTDYEGSLSANGLKVSIREVMNTNCVQTWELYLDIFKDKKVWERAARKGAEFTAFLKGLRPMRAAFSSGSFILGLMVAKKVYAPKKPGANIRPPRC